MSSIELLRGDCLDLLPTLAADSVDSCVTDPPYGLAFMGRHWDHGVPGPDFWREVYRVLKPGAHLAAFGGTRTYHRMACAIEDAGFEIRDSLMWIYGTGFPKSQDVAKFIDRELGVTGETVATGDAVKRMIPGADQNKDGWIKDDGREFVPHEYRPASPQAVEFSGFGTALKPAFEPIVLARKPLSEGTVAANVLRWGTGALNIDACRVPTWETITTHSRGNTTAFAKRPGEKAAGESGRVVPQNRPEFVGNERTGRWPANVVHDGSDEVVGAFPNTGAGSMPARRGADKNRTAYGDFKGQEGLTARRLDSGSAARFFYSAKASRQDRAGSKHPTVKPISLKQWLARLITPPRGLVLDPFAGSGTTGAACRLEGFRSILIEREPEYWADIERRMAVPAQERLL